MKDGSRLELASKASPAVIEQTRRYQEELDGESAYLLGHPATGHAQKSNKKPKT